MGRVGLAGTVRGGRSEAAYVLYLWKSSNTPGGHLNLLLGSFFLQSEVSALIFLVCLPRNFGALRHHAPSFHFFVSREQRVDLPSSSTKATLNWRLLLFCMFVLPKKFGN